MGVTGETFGRRLLYVLYSRMGRVMALNIQRLEMDNHIYGATVSVSDKVEETGALLFPEAFFETFTHVRTRTRTHTQERS